MMMARRNVNGNCLFVFALVCKEWRKAQLKVGGRLRTRVCSDVILPGHVALVKWVLAEGCPRRQIMVNTAAGYGHTELMKWLCGEGGFAMTRTVMQVANGQVVRWPPRRGGNQELVNWLKAEGCPEW